MKQMIQIFLDGESPTLIHRKIKEAIYSLTSPN